MALSSRRTALPPDLRRAGNIKRFYDIWLALDGTRGDFAGEGEGEWKTVKHKQQENNELDFIIFTFKDDTQLRISRQGALFSRRVDPNAEQESEGTQ